MADLKKVYVHAAAALAPHGATNVDEHRLLTADPDTDLRPLTKRLLGQGLRQASHFVELAAIGARLCLDRVGAAPAFDMAIYFGSGLGDLRKTESLFRQVLPPGPGMAAPFDFINASVNMAAFYVGRIAGVSARNLTVTQGVFSFEWALRLALDDLRAGSVRSALVGGADENCFPRSEYQRRWRLRDVEIMGEGSGWLFLSDEATDATAELLWIKQIPAGGSSSLPWAQAVQQLLGESMSDPLTLLPGSGISANDRDALARRLTKASWRSYLEYCGSYPAAAGFGMASCLERATPGQYVHINRDADGATMLIGWRV